MSPLRLTPQQFPKVWGSTRLEPWFPNPSEPIGEVWFGGVADSPLLIKFLFTSEKLSVQVHPEDEYARQHHASRGKTEMWHILAAEPGAVIGAGFRQPITAERLRSASVSGEIMDLIEWHEARPGDTFFIPAGTVHAIGPGLVLCEIQQNSDITYRLYDYGRPRELHLDDGVKVSRLGPHAARQQATTGVLVSCAYFTTEKIHVTGTLQHTPQEGRAEWWIVIEGQGSIAEQPTRASDVWYFAPDSGPFQVTGAVTVLRVHL